MKCIPLSDLNAEIRSTRVDDESIPSLWIDCPICGPDCWHAIHFKPHAPHGRGKVMWWSNPSGSTIADLTLSPSYLCTGYRCRVHAFVRNGVLELLPDSAPVPPKVAATEPML